MDTQKQEWKRQRIKSLFENVLFSTLLNHFRHFQRLPIHLMVIGLSSLLYSSFSASPKSPSSTMMLKFILASSSALPYRSSGASVFFSLASKNHSFSHRLLNRISFVFVGVGWSIPTTCAAWPEIRIVTIYSPLWLCTTFTLQRIAIYV